MIKYNLTNINNESSSISCLKMIAIRFILFFWIVSLG